MAETPLGIVPDKKKGSEFFERPSEYPVPTNSLVIPDRKENVDAIPRFEGLDLSAGDQAKVAGALLTTNDIGRQANAIRSVYPDAEFRITDEGGLLVKTENEIGFANKPGASYRDATGFIADLLKYFPAGKAATTGATLGSKALIGAGVSGGTSVVEDVANNALGGSEELTDIDGGKAAMIAGTAGVAEFAAPLLQKGGSFIKTLFGQPRYYNSSTGQLTEEGLALVKEAGVDVSSATAQVGNILEEQGRNATRVTANDAQTAARVGAADEFGIPLTQGQATRDTSQEALEDTLRNADVSSKAGETMRTFDAVQTEKIGDAARGIQSELGDTPAIMNRPTEAGETISEGVAQRAAAAKAASSKAYDEAAELGGEFTLDSFQKMQRRMKRVTQGELLPKQDFPGTYKVLGEIQKLDKLFKSGMGIKPFTLKQLEVKRRMIQRLAQRSSPEDARVVRQMQEVLDDYIDGAVDNAFFSGDDAAIDAIKKARGLYRQYKQNFTQRKAGDSAGAIVEKFANRGVTGEGVDPNTAMNWIFGASKVGGKEVTVPVLKRLKTVFGEGSQEWNALREAAWLKVTAKGMQGESISAQKLATALDDALTGSGESVMKSLFTQKELMQMARFNNAVKATIPTGGKKYNTSGTAYSLARMFQQASQVIGLGVSAASANPALALVALTGRYGKSGLNWSKARKAASGYKAPYRKAVGQYGVAAASPALADDYEQTKDFDQSLPSQ